MRTRTIALVGLILAALVGVLVIGRLNAAEEYRRLLGEGERALESGLPAVAVQAFSGAIVLRPASMVAYFRRGEAYASNGHQDRARADLMEARRLGPEAREPLEALGRLADAQGRPSEAATWYALAADRLTIADPRLLYALALARYRAGSPSTAREPLKHAISRDGSMAEAHYLLGLVSRDAQEPTEASVSLERAIRLSPGFVAAREELADLYREQGHTGDELLQLRALASLEPQIERYLALTMGYLRAGRHEEAMATVGQAEAADPADSRVALALARVHLAEAERAGDRAPATRAMAALERALGGTARRSEGLALLGRAMYLAGDAPGAERLLRDAVLTSPVDPEAYAFLADAAERLSHPAVARDALLKLDALEGDTVSGDARATRTRRIGLLALGAGDARMAVSYLDAAREAGITDAATLGLLARARWQTGDRDGARDALSQALARDGANAELRRLSRTIK